MTHTHPRIRFMVSRLLRVAALALCVVAVDASGRLACAQSCSGDVNGDGQVNGGDLATMLGQWGECPPVVTGVTPSHGSLSGGTRITVTGTRLDQVSAAYVGGNPCKLLVGSPTELLLETPPGELGDAAIAVETWSGQMVTSTVSFTYVLQAITSVSPNVGSPLGGATITISGTHLGGTTLVTIGGIPATNLVAVDANTVTAVTPAGSSGAQQVLAFSPKGIAALPAGFTYLTIPAWATMIEALPDPAIVVDETLRARIMSSGFAWRVKHTATQIEMLLVPPGNFAMGCSPSTAFPCDFFESPVHQVTLTNAFYIGRYEVTQSQWQARMGSNPALYQSASDAPSHPVEQVSWNAIQGFLTSTAMRLPTEAEWEYAYRAGTTTAFHSGPGFPNGTNDDALAPLIAWYSQAATFSTVAVGGKASNAFGCHDMGGNVQEWVADSLGVYGAGAVTNPIGPPATGVNMYRGGSWYFDSGNVRASFRYGTSNTYSSSDLGFRVAKNPF